MVFRYLAFFLSLLSLSCNFGNKPCEYGTATALFSDSISGVSRHEFEINGQNSFEKLRLDSLFELSDPDAAIKVFMPIQLQIIQSGCNELTQEFRIEFFDEIAKMPQNFSAPELTNIIVQVFAKISTLDVRVMAFAALAEALLQKQDEMQYGTETALKDGFSIQIDKMHSSESTIVTVIFKKTAN